MAFGSPYKLRPKAENALLKRARTIFIDYGLPLAYAFALSGVIKGTHRAIADFFDPELSEFYYDPSPFWLSH